MTADEVGYTGSSIERDADRFRKVKLDSAIAVEMLDTLGPDQPCPASGAVTRKTRGNLSYVVVPVRPAKPPKASSS